MMYIEQCSIDWERLVRILSALLTPVIALLAAYIAFQQYKTNKNQLRLALFEKRLKVFNSAGELIGTVLREAKIELADLKKFLWETRESDFLFGADITEYLHKLYGKASDLYALKDLPPEEIHRQTEVLLWFSGQGEELKKKFGMYMAFKD
jgi:hypothetical protein